MLGDATAPTIVTEHGIDVMYGAVNDEKLIATMERKLGFKGSKKKIGDNLDGASPSLPSSSSRSVFLRGLDEGFSGVSEDEKESGSAESESENASESVSEGGGPEAILGGSEEVEDEKESDGDAVADEESFSEEEPSLIFHEPSPPHLKSESVSQSKSESVSESASESDFDSKGGVGENTAPPLKYIPPHLRTSTESDVRVCRYFFLNFRGKLCLRRALEDALIASQKLPSPLSVLGYLRSTQQRPRGDVSRPSVSPLIFSDDGTHI